MGVFFYTHNVALAEDLSIDVGSNSTLDDFYGQVDASYQQVKSLNMICRTIFLSTNVVTSTNLFIRYYRLIV